MKTSLKWIHENYKFYLIGIKNNKLMVKNRDTVSSILFYINIKLFNSQTENRKMKMFMAFEKFSSGKT